MKALMLYVIMLAGGAAVGAFGVGAYNVFTGQAVVEEVAEGGEGEGEEGASGEGDEVAGGDEGEAGNVRTASGEPGSEPDEDAGDPAQAGEDEGGAAVEAADAGGGTATGQTPVTATTTPVVQVPPPDPDSLARLAENYQRLARIFSAMKPDEAAPVLAQLDDAQLEGILLAMQGRNAAPILAEMDPERAAALSRKVLRGNE